MKIFKLIAASVLFIGFLSLMPLGVFAQPVDPCTDPADPCPIDSNVYFLFGAAVIIAAKKTYDYKKKQLPV